MNMKVFVYRKRDSEKVCVLTDIRQVTYIEEAHTVVFKDSSNYEYKFNTRIFKTTIYQN